MNTHWHSTERIRRSASISSGIGIRFMLLLTLALPLFAGDKGHYGAVALGLLPPAPSKELSDSLGPRDAALWHPDWVLCQIHRASNGQLLVVPWLSEGQAREAGPDVEPPAQGVPLSEALQRAQRRVWPRLILPSTPETLFDVTALIARAHAASRIGWYSTNASELDQAVRRIPKTPTFYRPLDPDPGRLTAITLAGQIHCVLLAPAICISNEVRRLHEQRVAVGAWQPTEETELRRLLAVDVDYVFTAEPDRFISLQVSEGIRPSRAAPPARTQHAADQPPGGGFFDRR